MVATHLNMNILISFVMLFYNLQVFYKSTSSTSHASLINLQSLSH